MSRRELQSIKIDIAEKCYTHCADLLLMYNVRKTKNVLAPIEIAVDEVSRWVAARELVEVGEIIGMCSRRFGDLPAQQQCGDNAKCRVPRAECRDGDSCGNAQRHEKRKHIADSDVEMARQRDEEHRRGGSNRFEKNAVSRAGDQNH